MTLEEYLKIRNTVLGALDKAITEGDWEASLFFQNIGKRLQEVRDYVATELDQEEQTESTEEEFRLPKIKPGYVNIYISLYQADDNNKKQWENTIKALTEYNISRPIYESEEGIRTIIRSKADAKKEAYVVASIPESRLLLPQPGQPTEDKFNNRLLNLKEHSIKLDNIMEFVHMDQRYRVVDGRLV